MISFRRIFLPLAFLTGFAILLLTYNSTQNTKNTKNGRNNLEKYNITEHKNYILIDLGANNGDSLLSFFGLPPRFPQFINEKLNYRSFGKWAEAAIWRVYAFEANAKFDTDLTETVERIRKVARHKIEVFKQTAAWTYDGTIDFYVENATGYGLGSSIDASHRDVVRSGATGHQVACRDIGAMLKQFRKDDFVVMKIDIEGAEYELILDLVKKDAVKYVDHFAVEYHPWMGKFKTSEDVFDSLLKLFGASSSPWI